MSYKTIGNEIVDHWVVIVSHKKPLSLKNRVNAFFSKDMFLKK